MVRCYFNRSTKEQVSKKVARCLFQWKYKGTDFRKSGVYFNGSMKEQVPEKVAWGLFSMEV